MHNLPWLGTKQEISKVVMGLQSYFRVMNEMRSFKSFQSVVEIINRINQKAYREMGLIFNIF